MELKKVLDTVKYRGRKISLSNYTHLRAYHACRPENIKSYIGEGIVPFNKESSLAEATRKLSDDRVTIKKVQEQFNIMWEDSDANQHPKVWLALEKSELLGDSCHYLIYGSEFMNALAMHLGCRDKLKRIGRPTIVVCDVPLRDISETWLNGLEDAIQCGTSSMRSIAVASVVPKNVIDFIYPTDWVNDPYTGIRSKLSSNMR